MTSKRTSSKAFAGVKETEMKKRRPGRAKTKEEKAPGEPWTPENRVHTELVELAADTDIRVALPTLLNTLDNVSRAKTVEFIETPTNDTKDVLSRIAQLEFGPPASGCKGGRPPMDFSWIFFVLSVVVALGREEYLWEDIATYIYDMAMTPSELAQELAQEKERWEKKMRGEEVPPKASRKKNRPVPEGEERFVPDSPASATLRRYFGAVLVLVGWRVAHEDTEAAEEGGPFPGANFDCFKRTYQAQLKEEDEVKPHSVPQNQVDYERDPVRMLHVDEHTSGSTTFDSFYPGPMCFEEVMAAKVGPMCFEEVMAAKVVDNANLAGEHRGGEISYPCDLDDPQPRPPTFRLHIRKAHVAPPTPTTPDMAHMNLGNAMDFTVSPLSALPEHSSMEWEGAEVDDTFFNTLPFGVGVGVGSTAMAVAAAQHDDAAHYLFDPRLGVCTSLEFMIQP